MKALLLRPNPVLRPERIVPTVAGIGAHRWLMLSTILLILTTKAFGHLPGSFEHFLIRGLNASVWIEESCLAVG